MVYVAKKEISEVTMSVSPAETAALRSTETPADLIEVAVFSYNRGGYLKNCVQSVLDCMPGAKIVIYDDNSTDPATLATLADLAASGIKVVLPSDQASERHGGLYRNMQAALENAERNWLMLVQDDMQVVRRFDADDVAQIEYCFASDEKIAFICPFFVMGIRSRRYGRLLRPSAHGRFYEPSERALADLSHKKLAYFDVSLANVSRLRSSGWSYVSGEGINAAKARRDYAFMPFMGDPFLFFCPEVPFYRNRRQNFASRVAARVVGTDVKVLREMKPDEIARLRARDLRMLPVAEDWLQPVNPKVRRPFVYKDVAARWWLYAFHKFEQRWLTR